MANTICASQGIPEYLWQKDRVEDQEFLGDEILLRRFRIPLPEDFQFDDSIGVELFEMRDDSYNRTKYCFDNKDVLWNGNPNYNNGEHFGNYGVLAISVQELSVSTEFVLNGKTVLCQLQPVHRPDPCNYAHTEAWFIIDGIKKDSKKPAAVKTLFRRLLLKKFEVVKNFDLPEGQ